ncbi:hypothetical protein B7463_g8677, partial [Scytalidium lignicola]
MGNISTVLHDAIDFVRELGEQFLWVDALCIVQDNDDQKYFQIHQMDLVYGAAVLTIICAPPAPPPVIPDGLPDYRPGSRISSQVTENIQDLTLITTFVGLDSLVMYSRWDQRAWTFQEHRLSKRKLFFTELQLYFQCSCAVFCGNAVGEGCLPTAFLYAETSLCNTCNINAPQLQKRFILSTWISPGPPPNSLEGIDIYMRLFDQYSGRDDSIKMPYPSWTWAGWETKATYDYIFLGFILPEVDWFIVGSSGVTVKIHAPGTYNHSVHPPLGPDNKDVRPGDPPLEFLRSVKPREQLKISDGDWNSSHLLASWTTIALFMLTGESFDLNGYGGLISNPTRISLSSMPLETLPDWFCSKITTRLKYLVVTVHLSSYYFRGQTLFQI